MGYGDDLLVTKIAASEKKKYPNRQIVIGNIKKNNASHSIVYDNNHCYLTRDSSPSGVHTYRLERWSNKYGLLEVIV